MRRWSIVALMTLLLPLSACSSTSERDEANQRQLADQLVAATQAAGILPKLTPEVVESLYGTDARSVCDAFDGGLSTSAANLLLGNPGHGRRNTITTTAVTYAGLVIQTYCPDVLADFDEAVEDIDAFEVNQ